MAVVDELRTPVRIIYFYRSEDPIGQRARNILEVMGRRNPLLTVLTVDPDKQPELARREGVRLYNAAIVEAAGRRVLIQGTDEAEIAIGIQRVLRTRAAHRLLPRGPWRVLDGRLRVPYAPRGRIRPQPRRGVLPRHRDRRATASAGCAGL